MMRNFDIELLSSLYSTISKILSVCNRRERITGLRASVNRILRRSATHHPSVYLVRLNRGQSTEIKVREENRFAS